MKTTVRRFAGGFSALVFGKNLGVSFEPAALVRSDSYRLLMRMPGRFTLRGDFIWYQVVHPEHLRKAPGCGCVFMGAWRDSYLQF
jgi:hypothetical protein